MIQEELFNRGWSFHLINGGFSKHMVTATELFKELKFINELDAYNVRFVTRLSLGEQGGEFLHIETAFGRSAWDDLHALKMTGHKE